MISLRAKFTISIIQCFKDKKKNIERGGCVEAFYKVWMEWDIKAFTELINTIQDTKTWVGT